MATNPDLIIIPCHRVVNSDGRLGGYNGGIKKKMELLEEEGVRIEAGKVVDFQALLYVF